MPWKECGVLDQRLLFVSEFLREKPAMSEICRRYGISRKTGYKWLSRWQESGDLTDRSRAPQCCAHAISDEVKAEVIRLRRKHPRWGPAKIRALMQRDDSFCVPARSTIARILDDAGLVEKRRRKRRTEPMEGPLTQAGHANHVWCADFKGWFELGDKSRCQPFTLTDDFSRFILCCRHSSLETAAVQGLLEQAFREYGLPEIVRSDNGIPFAAPGVLGFSKLAVWLMKLGVRLERIEPGKPFQNGRHERMHLTLKTEVPKAANLKQQQKELDCFVECFNQQRPHESLEMQTPDSRFSSSARKFPDRLPAVEYPGEMQVRKVHSKGEIYFQGRVLKIGKAFRGEQIGLLQIDEQQFSFWFMNQKLGTLELKK